MKPPLQLITVGGSSTDPATRFVKYTNWQQVADLFTPWADGLMLRAVAGLSADDKLTDIGMSYEGKRLLVEVDTGDQARRDGMAWLVDDYYAFWADWLEEHQGKRLISYLGAVPASKAWMSAGDLWMRYYAPFAARWSYDKASVFIDCAAALAKNSPTYRAARYGQKNSCPVGIESLEVITQSHWAGFDVLTDHNRIRHAYDHPDGWQLARDVRKGGGTPYLGVVIDDRKERLECCKYWRHSDHGGWEIITYTHDLTRAEWEGKTHGATR